MKLVWCPEMAAVAYIDAVEALADRGLQAEANVAELVAAMAGGWRAQLVVEAWAPGGGAAASLALATVMKCTGGRHVCVVPDDRTRGEYAEALRGTGGEAAVEVEVVVGEAEEVMRELDGIDLVVVDCRRRDAGRVLRETRPGSRGMVVVCMNSSGQAAAAAAMMLAAGMRVVRAANLPIGRGMEILHVGVGKGPRIGGGLSRWIKHVDQDTGEEHLFRR